MGVGWQKFYDFVLQWRIKNFFDSAVNLVLAYSFGMGVTKPIEG
jgi:hypothetical protein